MSAIGFTQADAARLPLADCSVDLIFGSPPYCDARTYGIKAQRKCAAWVDWMLDVTTESMRVSRGPVIWVAAGVTRDRNYQPACEGLMWEWRKRGGDCQLYRPCIFHRVGIPGSGGKDWFRADTEYVMCFKRPGPLPWADNTAMGHPPKWAPGGEMSHRLSSGTRVNQWGPVGGKHGMGARRANGSKAENGKPSHVVGRVKRLRSSHRTLEHVEQAHKPPVKANPGNVIHLKVGGGLMGSRLAHENEAPFPEDLAKWFILSCCPPRGLVCDPFSGSGTTVSVAEQHDRRAIGFDLRFSQCQLGARRLAELRGPLFALA
jgi:hypothetical protein